MSQLYSQINVATAALVCASALALGGCGGDSGTPTSPSSLLMLQAFQTATQPGPSGIRVQMRARVTEGLSELRGATQSGTALGRVCLSGSCVDGPITSFSEGMCAGVPTIQAADTQLGLATAWLDGDVFGVDFCVGSVTEQRVFTTTAIGGTSQSNTIQTTCTPSGALIICGSD